MQSLNKTNSTMEGGYSATSASASPPVAPMIEIPDEKDQRFCVLSYEQVKRLNDLMSEVLSIDGRGNFPTIEVKLRDLVSVVRRRLEDDHGVKVKEVRLNGSGASSVLAADFASVDRDSDGNTSDDIAYNDLDLIFSVDLSTGRAYDRVKCAVLESLMQLLPEGVSRKRMSSCSMKEAYVSKMVKVNDNSDRWSLITLGNNRSKSVELKFVHTMRRQYEFSVDSFHVLLDTLFLFYECADAAAMPIGDAFYPTVVGESMYGDFGEALYHLRRKLIATRSPEEIRGGGLLKYCNLLCKGYRPAWPQEVKNMERYMCSRFFIDFPDMPKQQAKLENYLYNHFQGAEDRHKYEYLMILYHVVDESTVCLMGHERRLTLALIEDIAYQLYPDGFSDYAASSSSSSTSDSSDHPNLLSPMSMSDACSTISSASSVSSSGYTTPQKPETPGPSQPQMAPVLTANATTATTVQHSNGTSAATVITTTGHHALNTAIPPPNHPAAQQQQQQQQQQPTPASLIPTYEIVTSCQPAVVYSNGYYYTSFVQQQQPGSATQNANSSSTASPTLQVSTLTTTGPCLACSCGQQQQQQQWPVVASVGKKNNNNRQQQHHRQQQQRHHQNKQHHQQQQPPLHHQKLISS